jgi:hypothetical protein
MQCLCFLLPTICTTCAVFAFAGLEDLRQWCHTLFALLQHLVPAYLEARQAQPALPGQLPPQLAPLFEQEKRDWHDYVTAILGFLNEVLQQFSSLLLSCRGVWALLGIDGYALDGNTEELIEVDMAGAAQRLQLVLHCMDPQRFQASVGYV